MTEKTTIRLPTEIFRGLKESAKLNRRTMTAQLIVILEAALAAEKERTP